MRYLKTAVFSSLLLVLGACSSSDDGDQIEVVVDGGTESESGGASYRVTFTDQWSAENFPTEFPGSVRHFSGLIGATHNEQVIFWERGQVATPGIKLMAETGAKDDFSDEIDIAIAEGQSNQELSGDGLGNSPSSVSINFTLSNDYPLVTLVSMVAPSPDWYVGVGGLDLRGEDGEFVQALTVPLRVYDAGTDSGTLFTSANTASTGEVITRLSCEVADCDFLDGIHRNPAADIPTIGSFIFERTQ